MDYADSVQSLYSLGNELKNAKLGLERISDALAALGHPERACRFIHVAGTNGKGSTCAMIEAALRTTGVRTGLFTSPHLKEPTERIQASGQSVSPQQFAAAFAQVQATGVPLSYFESVTAMAFLIFQEERVDTVVLEVGLGGRLDATNVVMPELCAITPVDFDHQQFLGDTIEQIAAEKAGILKPGVPTVFAPQRPEAHRVLAAAGVPYENAAEWPLEVLAQTPRGSRFRTRHGITVDCPLAGVHQQQNALTAAVALHRWGLSARQIERGIAAAHWPGRLEQVRDRPVVLLDGAHNPAGAQALAEYLRQFYADRRIRLIFGAMEDKNVAAMADLLWPLASEVIVTAPDSPRALPPDELARLLPHANIRAVPRFTADLAAIGPHEVAVITGSLYLVGEARPLLVK